MREYKESHYAVSEITDIEESLAHSVLFLRIYGYTIGDNVECKQLYMFCDTNFSDCN